MTGNSPFAPRVVRHASWGPLQQSCCEAIRRGIVDRNYDMTHSGLERDQENLHQRIRTVVEWSDERSLSRLLMRDLNRNGMLPGGWSARWPAPPQPLPARPPQMPREFLES